MNGEQFAGIFRQLAERMNESWGELTGDRKRAAAGRRGQLAGKTQQQRGIENEAAARQMKDFLERNRHWH